MSEMEKMTVSEIKMKLGDIIQIESTNSDFNSYFLVEYIDNETIKIININDGDKQTLDLDSNGCLIDITIQKIYLLSRSDEEGYARQNGLIPNVYVKLVFEDEIEITGKIIDLEEDMIEIMAENDKSLYIDFEYKGIPKNIPLKKIAIIEQPTIYDKIEAQEKAQEKAEKKAQEDESNTVDKSKTEDESTQSIDIMPITTTPIFGDEKIEFYADDMVWQQRYGIEMQTTDLLNELLSTIPDNKRSSTVMDRIYRIINRFKELREQYSTFDENGNITGSKNITPMYKPLVEHMKNLDINLRWILPVVSQKTKIYTDKPVNDENILPQDLLFDLNDYKTNLDAYKLTNNYSAFYNGINNIFTPFQTIGGNLVNTNLETIVDSLEDYYTYVYKHEDLISKKRFFIQRYNLGMTKLSNKEMKSGKSVYVRKNISNNDSVDAKSVIMLPKQTLEFSRVELPGTNILTKCGLSKHWLHYFRFLTKKTSIKMIDIDNVNMDYDYDENQFLEEITGFNISKLLDADYESLLNAVIPRTAGIIRRLKSNYIGYNFHDLISHFEPFLIYNDTITYSGTFRNDNIKIYEGKGGPYQELRTYVIENVENFLKRLIEQRKKYAILKKVKSANQKKLALYEHLQLEIQDKIHNEYKLGENPTNTEVLNKIIGLDNGEFFMSILSVLTAKLYTPDLAELLEMSEYGKDPVSSAKKCFNHVIAKKYTSYSALMKDSGNEEVYFDKEYDSTPYDILKKYKEAQQKQQPAEFIDYFTTVLKKEHNIADENVAKTIIQGKKRVEDNNYAVLIIYPKMKSAFEASILEQKEEEIEAEARKQVFYYKRKGNEWIADSDFAENNETLCNMDKDCFYDKSNDFCDSNKNAAAKMKKIAKKSLFETSANATLEEFKKLMENNYALKEKHIKKIRLIKEANLEEASNIAYSIGKNVLLIESEELPHFHIRDQMLAETDFIKKQEYIIQYVKEYCRDAIESESIYWLYCKKTNLKLLPIFLYKLAKMFFAGKYEQTMEQIISTQGQVSDDGDAVVDKHSGYIIKYRDLVAQEEFTEEGFIVTTHAVIQKTDEEIIEEAINIEIETNQANKSIKPKQYVFENEIHKYVHNVSSALVKSLGVDFESIDDIILSESARLITNNLYSEAEFERKLKKKESKSKYEDYKNQIIFYMTVSVTFIVIQTRVPSFQPNKTYPGCIYSLAGYPLDMSAENKSGINYVCCILEKMKTKHSQPWKSVSKLTSTELMNMVVYWTDKKILEDSRIKKMLELKRAYLLVNPENIHIPDEHSVEKWLLFQPPLIQTNIVKTVSGVSKAFGSEIADTIKSGHRDQHQHIGNLYKKIIENAYSVVDDVNSIVSDVGKGGMLKAGTVIFLENSCCEETEPKKVIDYFSEKNENIRKSIDFVNKYQTIYDDIKSLSIPSFVCSKMNRTEYVSANSGDYSERNSYLAFIHYCKLNSDLPIPDDLQHICQEKIPGFNTLEMEQAIQTLIDNGKKQTPNTLAELMKKVSQRNHVDIVFSDESVPKFDDLYIQDNIDTHLKTALKTKEEKPLVIYLDTYNNKMQEEIVKFLRNSGALKRAEMKKLFDFIENITMWNDYRNIHIFIKNAIHNISNVIPSILNNNGMRSKDLIHKHWGFAPSHVKNLENFINEYFKDIFSYNKNENVCSLFQNISMDDEIKDINLLMTQMVQISNMLSRDTMCKIYKYCYLSLFYKIITESATKDIVLTSSIDEDGNVDILMEDDKAVFFQQVSSLIIILMNTDMKNKKMTNFSYSELSDKYHKTALAEKKKITDDFKAIVNNEDRKVESTMMMYKLGRWSTDDSVYVYKKEQYEKEIGMEEVPGNNEEFVLEEGDEDRYDNELQ